MPTKITILPDDGRLPSKKRPQSMLVDETRDTERERRLTEQAGHRSHLGVKVNAREHATEEQLQQSQTGELGHSNALQHPDPRFQSQCYSGVDKTLNPVPDVNPEGKLKYANERRDQEKEKLERLEKVLGMGKRPKFSPRPGGP